MSSPYWWSALIATLLVFPALKIATTFWRAVKMDLQLRVSFKRAHVSQKEILRYIATLTPHLSSNKDSMRSMILITS